MSFDLMRLIAALLVVVSHTFPLSGQPPLTIMGVEDLGALGVSIFFVISGFLVSASYLRDPKAYLLKRVLRIEPGLIAALAITVVALGFMTTAPTADYAPRAAMYVLRNALFIPTDHDLPGLDPIVTDHRHHGGVLAVQHRGQRNGDIAALRDHDLPAPKGADAEPRIAADENIDLAELGAAVDDRGDGPDPARDFAGAGDADLRHLAGRELGQLLGWQFAQQFEFAPRDDLKQRSSPHRCGGPDGGVHLENDAGDRRLNLHGLRRSCAQLRFAR